MQWRPLQMRHNPWTRKLSCPFLWRALFQVHGVVCIYSPGFLCVCSKSCRAVSNGTHVVIHGTPGIHEQHAGVAHLLYRKPFQVPKEWKGQRIMLRFGAVDWEAKVFVNGHRAGVHRGGYGAFVIVGGEYGELLCTGQPYTYL